MLLQNPSAFAIIVYLLKGRIPMRVYDFDNTIFRGDSTTRFYFYCLRRRPTIFFGLFPLIPLILKYPFGKSNKTEIKEKLYRFMEKVDCEALLPEFWKKNIGRIKKFYIEQKQQDDIIISAAPEFLIAPCMEALGIKYFYASRVDAKSGKYDGVNCHGEEKIRRFDEAGWKREDIEAFYSDSYSDTPFAKISLRAYLVKGDKITDWK